VREKIRNGSDTRIHDPRLVEFSAVTSSQPQMREGGNTTERIGLSRRLRINAAYRTDANAAPNSDSE